VNPFIRNNSLLFGAKKEDQPDFPHDPNNLVLVYDTSLEPANNTISVPLNGTVNCTINWGDDSSDSYTTTGFKTHTYDSPGVYVVQISGTMTNLSYGISDSNTNNKRKLVRCLSFGNIGLTRLESAFRNCVNFIQCPDALPPAIITLDRCFSGCEFFNDNRVTNWITSNVRVMSFTFQSCKLFNQPLHNWNTDRVTTMFGLFQNCSEFNQSLNNWNTSLVTNMAGIFNGCSSFNQPLNSWDTSNAVSMFNLFRDCFVFNQPLNNWNVFKVTRMDFMFNSANAFSQDISSWDIRQVTNMSNMFSSNNWGTANYDAALIAWSQLVSPQTGISFGVGTNKYSSAAASARNALIDTYNWSISDGGVL